MADATTQLRIQEWVREVWMPQHCGMAFFYKEAALVSGGVYRFNAVSDDGKMVATITTSSPETSSGKGGVGKKSKIRASMSFLMLAKAERKLILFTDRAMLGEFLREKQNGRMPLNVELMHVPLPAELQDQLKANQEVASLEVRPG